MARPSKLTKELQQQLCSLISRGHYASNACAAVGLGETTFHRWMELGSDHLETRDGHRILVKAAPPYQEFREAIEKSRATAQMAMLESIRDAAFEMVAGPDGHQKVKCKNWTAAAWYLERTRPDQYARRDVVHVGEGAGPRKPEEPTKKVVRFGGRYKVDGSLQTSAGKPADASEDDE